MDKLDECSLAFSEHKKINLNNDLQHQAKHLCFNCRRIWTVPVKKLNLRSFSVGITGGRDL
jgi:hypothetical protein